MLVTFQGPPVQCLLGRLVPPEWKFKLCVERGCVRHEGDCLTAADDHSYPL